jgi:UDP-glucuronate decarboxylase
LVTGGAGFIGQHLVKKLLLQGNEVIVADNFSSGSRQSLADYEKVSPRLELIRHDVTFPLYVEVDEIYHLACPASPVAYQRDPVQTTKTCVHGTINMLGLARRLNAKILLASTSEVYGDPEEHPQREDYVGHVNTLGPRACYDEGKRCAETLFMDYWRQHSLRIRIARIFNTYGPGMAVNDGRVVSSLICQALRNQPLPVYGDGSQSRSFCYIDDMVEGLVALMRKDVVSPVNLGNPHEVSVQFLAERVKELTGSGGRITYCPLPADDPKRRCPDITRARDYLDWEPKTLLSDGLEYTIKYFADLLGTRVPVSRT